MQDQKNHCADTKSTAKDAATPETYFSQSFCREFCPSGADRAACLASLSPLVLFVVVLVLESFENPLLETHENTNPGMTGAG